MYFLVFLSILQFSGYLVLFQISSIGVKVEVNNQFSFPDWKQQRTFLDPVPSHKHFKFFSTVLKFLLALKEAIKRTENIREEKVLLQEKYFYCFIKQLFICLCHIFVTQFFDSKKFLFSEFLF